MRRTTTKELIIDYLKLNPGHTAEEIANALEEKYNTVRFALRELTAQGALDVTPQGGRLPSLYSMAGVEPAPSPESSPVVAPPAADQTEVEENGADDGLSRVDLAQRLVEIEEAMGPLIAERDEILARLKA